MNGCLYNTGTEARPMACRKLCDKGEIYCPHHLLLLTYGEGRRSEQDKFDKGRTYAKD